MQPALSGSVLQWGRVSDPTAALSGSQIKATGFAGGYLLDAVRKGQSFLNEIPADVDNKPSHGARDDGKESAS
jgi:hypothetical protein